MQISYPIKNFYPEDIKKVKSSSEKGEQKMGKTPTSYFTKEDTEGKYSDEMVLNIINC